MTVICPANQSCGGLRALESKTSGRVLRNAQDTPILKRAELGSNDVNREYLTEEWGSENTMTTVATR